LQFGYSHGCAVGDISSDGFDDLYVTALGNDSLWSNNGDGTFSDISNCMESRAPGWGSSAAFADLNRDGHLDLYVANYLDESDESPRLCPPEWLSLLPSRAVPGCGRRAVAFGRCG
jgi:hypothetical protein